MSTSILKTHYRRSATILTPEQIEEIRHLKNKVPVYMIVKEYHINKNRVHDIWNDCERSQQNGNHFFEELRKVQSISSVPPSENSPQDKENNHSPISGSLKSLDESISREISCPSMTPSFLESIETDGSPLDRVHEKQKKKKKSSRPKPVQSSNLPEISTEGSYQNSLLDVSYDLIASIEKNNIEAEEAIHESEKCLARNSSFSPVYSSKVLH
ncbi:hypothetical protein RCL_jg27569.t1 [Rhizophagus clarus]|uniref:Uncharacterized protein n=1 Tax=Rhizophagus clarus TaxID=94130 RepID=A0A8H3LXI2_9GLOM|nr:hypothetical protein RCL_jg27569.t1 [Rhizophagus clarus]